MWQPDLHPLPCRQSVAQRKRTDGRHTFSVREAVSSGTVLEVSLCLAVSITAIDRFPYLRDFVITGEAENDILVATRLLPPCVPIPPMLCRSRRSEYWRTCWEGSVCPCSIHSQPMFKLALIALKPVLGPGLWPLSMLDMNSEYMYQSNQSVYFVEHMLYNSVTGFEFMYAWISL